MAQANTFCGMGYETFILTFNFNMNYEVIIPELIQRNQLDSSVKFLNMYDALCGKEEVTSKDIPIETGYIDPHIGHNGERIYENGVYKKYKKYHSDGCLDFIEHFNEQRYRIRKDIFDRKGNIRKTSYMDYITNKPRQMFFYRNNGDAYMSKWVNPETGLAIRVNLFDQKGNIEKIYSNDDQLKTEWIERLIKTYSNPVIVSDARNTDQLLVNIKNKSAVKIWRLHSNHLKAPFEVDSDIAPPVKIGFENLDKFDAAVFLTEQQKKDIEKRVGTKHNLYVIPHAVQSKIQKGLFGRVKHNKDEKKGVIVGRYASIKNLPHIIEAFKLVVQAIPDAKLEFWGSGTEKEKLQTLVEYSNLSQNIKIHGYSKEPSKVYQSALFSVLTSKTEGFSLSVLESMSNSTPVISYDIKYGPSEMIDHEVNGLLIEKDNITDLANGMISLFKNPKKAIKMGKEALNKVEKKYSQEVYEHHWKDVVESSLNRKNNNGR